MQALMVALKDPGVHVATADEPRDFFGRLDQRRILIRVTERVWVVLNPPGGGPDGLVEERRCRREDVVRRNADVVVPRDAPPVVGGGEVHVQVARDRLGEALREVHSATLLVVAGVDHEAIVIFREQRRVILRRAALSAYAQIAL